MKIFRDYNFYFAFFACEFNSRNEITKNIKVRSILSENIYMNDRLRLINNNLPAVLKYNNTKGIVDEQLDYIINEITMVNSGKFYDTIERVYKTEDKELEQQSCSNDAFF